MNKIVIFVASLFAFGVSHADRGTAPEIFTRSWRGPDRASTCQQAISLAESAAINLSMLQFRGKVENLEKKCDCGEEREENFATKKTDKYWSCLGTVSYTYKK